MTDFPSRARQSQDAKLASAYCDLEDSLHNARHMAYIAERQVNETLCRPEREGDGFVIFKLSDEEWQVLSFAVIHSRDMVEAVMEEWREGHAAAVGDAADEAEEQP